MSITIIGAGNMAKGLAGVFQAAGFEVVLAARTVAKAAELAAELGPRVSAEAIAEAVKRSDVVVLAVPYEAAAGAIGAAGALAGKIVIDITNPLTADYMGLTIGHDTSAAEEIQALAPKAKVVKAFNTLFAQLLQAGGKVAGHGATVFIAGDDDAANSRVAEIAAKAGFTPLLAGPLKRARYLEPLAGLNIALGYGQGLGTAIAPEWAGL